MKIGMHTGQQDCSFDDLRRAWRFADEHGYAWISVWDHFYEAPYIDGESVTYETVSAFATRAFRSPSLNSFIRNPTDPWFKP